MLKKLSQVAGNRWIPWILVGMGIARSVLLLLAYPPAHASDSLGSFAYAQRFSGYLLPDMGRAVYPLYSVLIWLTTGGSIYILIASQIVMAIAVAPLYYLALKRFSPALALVFSLVLVSDLQVMILFNFTSSEPLYVFLMAVTFYVFWRGAQQNCPRGWCASDVWTGVLLVLLLLTRSVARYMLPAFLVILVLMRCNWRRPVALLAGFGAACGIWIVFSLVTLGRVNGFGTQEFFLWGSYPNHFASDVSADNGPNSEVYIESREDCDTQNDLGIAYCVEDETGSWSEAMAVLRGTTFETILAAPQDYLKDILEEFGHLLATSGLMFAYADAPTPSNVQCETGPRDLNRDNLTSDRITAGLADASDQKLDDVEALVNKFRAIMCPPLPSSSIAKDLVDRLSTVNPIQWLADRYHFDSGRYDRGLWYELVLIYVILPLLTLVLPWVRCRFAPVVLSTVAFLTLHALAGAVVFNVQPNRFAVVTNPLRPLLLIYLLYVLAKLILKAIQAWRLRWDEHSDGKEQVSVRP